MKRIRVLTAAVALSLGGWLVASAGQSGTCKTASCGTKGGPASEGGERSAFMVLLEAVLLGIAVL